MIKRTTALLLLPILASTELLKDVTKPHFTSLLKEKRIFLASFSSNSLESVQPFNQQYQSAAQNVETAFVSVNCDTSRELCDSYDVNSYPAIRLFESGNQTDRYRGRRTSSAITSYIKKRTLPPLTFTTPTTHSTFLTTDHIVLLAYLPPSATDLSTTFNTIASKYHNDYIFGISHDIDSALASGLTVPSIVCYKNLDGDNRVLNGKFTAEDVERFLELATPMVVGEFNERSMPEYMSSGKLAAYVFLPATADQGKRSELLKEITPVAKKYEKYVKFGIADAKEYGPMAKNFGLKEEVWPALVVDAPMKNQFFPFVQGKRLSAEAVERMLLTILEGKATPGVALGEGEEDMKQEEKENGHDEL